jgi:hypothetical protein
MSHKFHDFSWTYNSKRKKALVYLFDDLLKAVKEVTRKSRYSDTEARTGIGKADCTKPIIEGRKTAFNAGFF